MDCGQKRTLAESGRGLPVDSGAKTLIFLVGTGASRQKWVTVYRVQAIAAPAPGRHGAKSLSAFYPFIRSKHHVPGRSRAKKRTYGFSP